MTSTPTTRSGYSLSQGFSRLWFYLFLIATSSIPTLAQTSQGSLEPPGGSSERLLALMNSDFAIPEPGEFFDEFSNTNYLTLPGSKEENAIPDPKVDKNKTVGTPSLGLSSPEINIQGNGITIADGDLSPDLSDATDFASLLINNQVVHTFTIQNTGSIALNVTSINVSGSHSGDFALGGFSPATQVPAGSSTTFTLTFSPSAGGLRSTLITVNSDDSDEATYEFAVQGTGIEQNVLDFDGVGDYVLLPANAIFDKGSSDFTWEAWFKTSNTTDYKIIIGNDVSPQEHLGINATVLRFAANNGGLSVTGSSNVADGCWHHVALTRSGNSFTMYLDGEIEATGSSTHSVVAGSDYYIGRKIDNFNFIGQIDE
ncbi:MAG: choice-of-anchor D domain-containing protein, partial [Bacteroidota bacterium]